MGDVYWEEGGGAITIRGLIDGERSFVRVDAHGEDMAMLPTTIDELSRAIDSWVCLRCGAPLEPDEIKELEAGRPIQG